MIGYHQPDLSIGPRTRHRVMPVSGQCNRIVKGQLTRRACVSGQDAHFADLTVVFVKTYNRCLVSFSNFVIVVIN